MIKQRRSRRSPVLLAATVDVGGASVPVKLRNLSEEGALVEGERLPAEGETTCFKRNELAAVSRVVWVQGRYAGLAFGEPLKPEQVLRNIPTASRRVNEADFRRPGLACRPLTDYERRMLETWMTASPVGHLGE